MLYSHDLKHGRENCKNKQSGLEYNQGYEGHGLGCPQINGLGDLTVKRLLSNAFFIGGAPF
jgi:hypothetical protein